MNLKTGEGNKRHVVPFDEQKKAEKRGTEDWYVGALLDEAVTVPPQPEPGMKQEGNDTRTESSTPKEGDIHWAHSKSY